MNMTLNALQCGPSLYLQEEIVLLALHDQKGNFASHGWFSQAISGALLAELILHDRIRLVIEEGKDAKDGIVELVDAAPIGEPLLDECLTKITEDDKPRSAEHWVTSFGSISNAYHRVAEGLVDREILRIDKKKILFIFQQTVYPERDPIPEQALRQRLHTAIFDEAKPVDERTAVLTAILHPTGMLSSVLDRKELKEREARIKQIASGDAVGASLRASVEAAQAVVTNMLLTSAATTAATTMIITS